MIYLQFVNKKTLVKLGKFTLCQFRVILTIKTEYFSFISLQSVVPLHPRTKNK